MKSFIILSIFLFHGGGILGAPVNKNSMQEDVLEILKMIPRDKITEIALNHLKTDDGFKAAIDYMKSDEWVKLVQTVREKTEWIDFKQLLGTFGLPLDTLIFCMETFVQNVTVPPFPEDTPRNLTAFIIDIQGIIPLTDILTKFHEKLKSQPELETMLEKLKAPESKTIVETALNLPDVRLVLNAFKEMGFNLYDMVTLLYFFLGWGEFKHVL